MRKAILEEHPLDMLISNYVYDKAGVKRKKVMRYTSILPTDTYFTWEDMGHFRQDQYIIMHSVIYRTELLRECGLVLPKHTFYVDNILFSSHFLMSKACIMRMLIFTGTLSEGMTSPYMKMS